MCRKIVGKALAKVIDAIRAFDIAPSADDRNKARAYGGIMDGNVLTFLDCDFWPEIARLSPFRQDVIEHDIVKILSRGEMVRFESPRFFLVARAIVYVINASLKKKPARIVPF